MTIPRSLEIQDIYEEIDQCDQIQEVISRISAGEEVKSGYQLIEGRLLYKKRLVIPNTSRFIPLILKEYHDGMLGGHAGVLRTVKRIQENFHWSGMREMVQKHVAECQVCQTSKHSTLSPAGLLQPLPILERIWEDISMDYIEGLPNSQGMNVIFVVVDRLSKYAHFLSLHHPFNAMDVAQNFTKEVVRLHGFPRSIVSDRDKIFHSNFWRELFKLAGTQLKFSTAYHPQTDGQTEVLNRCLETYLWCFTSAHPRHWHKFLSWAELGYNTSYHTAVKTSPFQIVYGREPPSFLQFEKGATQNGELEAMLQERDQMINEVKEHLSRAQSIMKDNADKHRREVNFEVGSLVFFKLRPYRQTSITKRLCQKLSTRFYGPFKILERIGKVAYRLKLPDDSKIHPVFHVSQLKQVLGKDHVVSPLSQALSPVDELVVEPDQILETRYSED
ncbi:unnamed protein product [Microthlaspi erraticum]|uniref:Integrase catalytic domain-containing protein n=1 Tax=Microthlaspi erraticum TaxID=1685480 RepID=A0A6D2JYQ2_9BRAS|nr:unnamed protein product [Microthlaspi erraticum]